MCRMESSHNFLGVAKAAEKLGSGFRIVGLQPTDANPNQRHRSLTMARHVEQHSWAPCRGTSKTKPIERRCRSPGRVPINCNRSKAVEFKASAFVAR
jgi:hypothetical protein